MRISDVFRSRRRSSLAAALICSGCVAVFLASPLGSAIGGETSVALETNAPVVVAQAEAQALDPEASGRPAAPNLNATHRVTAERVLRRSRVAMSAAANGRFSIAKAGPLTGPSGAMIGAVFEVRLAEPVALHDQPLPTADPDPKGTDDPPYQAYLARYTAPRVAGYMVLIDLTRNAVIAMTPLPGSEVSKVALPDGFVPKYGIHTESGADITVDALAAHNAMKSGADPAPAAARASAKALEVAP